MSLVKPVCIGDFEEIAKTVLPRNAWDYYASGAEAMQTLEDNRTAFSRIRLRPRVLIDVSRISLETQVLGQCIQSPIGVSPSAMQRMAHDEGERATARACAAMNTCMILSSWSTTCLEDVAEAGRSVRPDTPGKRDVPSPVRWFQLYVYKDRDTTRNLIKRAEKAGYGAIVVTVDTPYLGRRLADIRNKFLIPPHLTLANLEAQGQGEKARMDHVTAAKGKASPAAPGQSNTSGLATYVVEQTDASLTWDVIRWLRSVTSLPVIVKGVMTAEDARLAIHHGVDGVMVSNHGGRQLDGALSTIEALPDVVEAVNGAVDVYLDGGVRRGTDVFKALALGAKAVFIGRPVLWALAYKGEEGVKEMLQLLEDEFKLTMALSGCTEVSQISRRHLVLPGVSNISSQVIPAKL
ncbi:Hydroxyacid oxidase 1 [Dispira simplex]|nr:Hydroxyacid oxidase 1 [Dispira simplex]